MAIEKLKIVQRSSSELEFKLAVLHFNAFQNGLNSKKLIKPQMGGSLGRFYSKSTENWARIVGVAEPFSGFIIVAILLVSCCPAISEIQFIMLV